MSSTVGPGDTSQIKALVIQDMIATSILLTSATIFFHYCITNLDKEVEYIWSRKWNAGKVMYFLTRYSGALFLGITVLYTVGLRKSAQVIISEEPFEDIPLSTVYLEIIFSYFFVTFGPVIMIFAEIILQMRIYAIYGRKKWIIVLSVILNLASAVVCILQIFNYSYILSDMACENSKFACSTSLSVDPVYGRYNMTDIDIWDASSTLALPSMAALVWVVFSVVESILFILVFRKAEYGCFWRVKNHTKLLNKTHDIMVIVARDSTSYFTIVFTVGVVGVVMFVVAETVDFTTETDSGFVYLYKLLGVYEAIAIAITSILAPRMLINIRLEVYHQKGLNESTTHNASTFYAVSGNGDIYPSRLEGGPTSFP